MATQIQLRKTPGPVGAWVAKPSGKPKGGVVVVQEIYGVNAHIRSVVNDYAAAGYMAVAPAMFDLVRPDVELNYDSQSMQQGLALVRQIEMDAAVDLVRLAAERIGEAGKVGVVGYCWGGTVAYLSATRLGLPAFSYYGGRNTQHVDETARAPLMFHYGEQDPHITAADRESVRKANPEADFHVYPAGHGFNCDVRDSYDAASAELARERTLDFFTRHLGG